MRAPVGRQETPNFHQNIVSRSSVVKENGNYDSSGFVCSDQMYLNGIGGFGLSFPLLSLYRKSQYRDRKIQASCGRLLSTCLTWGGTTPRAASTASSSSPPGESSLGPTGIGDMEADRRALSHFVPPAWVDDRRVGTSAESMQSNNCLKTITR